MGDTSKIGEAAEPAEYLEWDSQFFGRRIAKVRGQRLTEPLAGAAMEWCANRQIECLYFLADPEPVTIATAERHGFALMDVRLEFERGLEEIPDVAPGVREARADDIERLQQIAGRNFSDSRFYADPHFSPERCDELFATWISRSYEGFANRVLVAERDGEPVGFTTCHLKGTRGTLGLTGVATSVQGKGVGRQIILTALHYLRDQGLTSAAFVTQARNIASQRMHRRCGFMLESTSLWYHRWFEK